MNKRENVIAWLIWLYFITIIDNISDNVNNIVNSDNNKMRINFYNFLFSSYYTNL